MMDKFWNFLENTFLGKFIGLNLLWLILFIIVVSMSWVVMFLFIGFEAANGIFINLSSYSLEQYARVIVGIMGVTLILMILE